MDKEKLSKRDVINLTSIARNGKKPIDERIKALNRLSNYRQHRRETWTKKSKKH